MEKLGVDHVLTPYETQPWMYYDEAQGITCSAEVRMGTRGDDVEAEVQFIKDEGEEGDSEGEGGGGSAPPPPPPPPEGEVAKDPFTGAPLEVPDEGPPVLSLLKPGKPYQVMFMRILPMTEKEWTTKKFLVKAKSYENDFHGWEEKGCDFFRACIEAMQMGEIPDIEALIDSTLHDGSWGGSRRGRVGRKSPKIKPAQLLGLKQGM